MSGTISDGDEIKNRLRLLTVADLVELNVGSRASCYRLINSGAIPCVRRGRSVRVRVVDLEDWLSNGGSIANVVPFRRPKPAKKSA